jgi:hypothetical protein
MPRVACCWPHTVLLLLQERGRIIYKLADLIERDQEQLALLETLVSWQQQQQLGGGRRVNNTSSSSSMTIYIQHEIRSAVKSTSATIWRCPELELMMMILCNVLL